MLSGPDLSVPLEDGEFMTPCRGQHHRSRRQDPLSRNDTAACDGGAQGRRTSLEFRWTTRSSK